MNNTFWILFTVSFTVALSGAMSPGPLLTYTIIKSLQDKHHGYLIGALVVTGHAIIEFILLMLILKGLSTFLVDPFVIKIIGIFGGLFLILFGVLLFRDVKKNRISLSFLKEKESSSTLRPSEDNEESPLEKGSVKANSIPSEDTLTSSHVKKKRTSPFSSLVENPVIGGILVSMSNPYWWIWWVTIGLSLLINYNVTLVDVTSIAGFFLGHEAGDLVWYLLVSVSVYLGKRSFNKKVYYSILIACALFMVLFGFYLGISILFS